MEKGRGMGLAGGWGEEGLGVRIYWGQSFSFAGREGPGTDGGDGGSAVCACA